MPAFPNDALDAAWCDGDLLLQCCANSRETVIHAVRDIIKHCPDKLAARWKMDGFLPAAAVRHAAPPSICSVSRMVRATLTPQTPPR
jgi:deferrochelatase/peroxidase EfeB